MIVYAKFNNARDPGFQLVTKIIDEKGKLFVLKEAASPASVEFLQSIKDKYLLLTGTKVPFGVSKPELSEGVARFDFLDVPSLDDEIRSAILDKSGNSLLNIFEKYLRLVDSIPHHIGTLSPEFCKVFGSYEGKHVLAEVGCLDITPENLKISNDKYLHIDYEWTFGFPIPLSYIFIRSAMNTYAKYRNYNISKILPFEELLKECRLTEEHLKQALFWENNFQSFVHGAARTTVITTETFLTSLKQEAFVGAVTERDSTIKKANSANDILASKVAESEARENTLRTELSMMTNSRVWKARNVVARLFGKKELR